MDYGAINQNSSQCDLLDNIQSLFDIYQHHEIPFLLCFYGHAGEIDKIAGDVPEKVVLLFLHNMFAMVVVGYFHVCFSIVWSRSLPI